MKQKHIVFIPPNGEFKKQDFSLLRITTWLKTVKTVKTTLLFIRTDNVNFNTDIFDTIIEVNNKEEILKKLKKISCDIIFNRSWMHSYQFSKQIVEKFDNVVVNIKDWNFCSEKEYKFLFGNSKDFKAIQYIFKHSKYILSHFTIEQAKLWAAEYNIDEDRFIFFPEYCNEESFIDKHIEYKNIKIVYAGKILPSTFPEQLFPSKSHLRSIRKLTEQNIMIDFVVPEKEYEDMRSNRSSYLDFLYEDKFNKRFKLVKGKALDPIVLKEYHFGFFELETSGENKSLYEYAVTSKLAFYLEANLPILINKDFISIANVVSKYNLGILFCNDDLNSFSKVLNISQEEYNQFVNNIKKFRDNFTYDSNQQILERIFSI